MKEMNLLSDPRPAMRRRGPALPGFVAGLCLAFVAGFPAAARAGNAVSCGGMAMLGAAELLCSHVAPKAPPQLCTFEWSLLTSSGQQKMAEGTFMLPPGASNVQVYQASGFDRALASPVILCHAVKGQP